MGLLHFLLAALPLAVSAGPILARADNTTVDCAPNSSSGLKAECWAALGMDKYITEWMAANGTKANCDQLGFAQCFLQFNGYTGLTCNLITSDTCSPFQTNSPEKYYSNQQFYALWNIYTIYQFFNQYSQALSNGASLAGQTIDAIVAKVAPPVESPTSQTGLMKVLGSTLDIVSMFTGFVPGDSGIMVGFIRAGLGAAFGLSQKLGQTLGVTQTADDRFIQLGDIGSKLAGLVSDYQDNLLATVQEIQGNHTVFLAACQEGGFSQRVTTALTIQASELYRKLQLFVLSSALKANGIVSSRSTGVKVLDFAKTTDEISCEAFSEGGNCNQWWYDESGGNTYALHNPNDWENTHIDLTFAIYDNGWATLDEIFKVEDCAGKDPTFDASTLGFSCLASHSYCEWNYSSTPNEARGNGQFTNCENDGHWGYLCGSFQSGILVPESYLGPLLTTDGWTCKKLSSKSVSMAGNSSDTQWQFHPPYQQPDQPSPEREGFQRKIQGSCHCGKVRFWLSREKPLAAKYCHCKDCRVIHGAPFQWAAIFHKSDIEFENGARGLKFYNSSSKETEHHLPCKVSCAHCGSLIMDEGRNMALMFPTLLKLDGGSLRRNFEIQCHIFYPQRVVNIPDGKPKWTGLDGKSELMEEKKKEDEEE
ncbi:hypothetical protein B0T10DRAFT_592168 [Thelonectria olida]|uniref:CENP-V/GFA domain-containing protein n=1 Tax=Thelonectria olida TaxID=1576542 RepID=A0A9P9ARR1_9HYPO|nr:hypothetical protein B0T10DRAFT_592168 [Thelonectria olida]